jgi:thiamine pyrophosphokinase
VIITSYQSAPIREFFELREDDFIICADGGYSHAVKEKITPHAVIGDFDSIGSEKIMEDLKQSCSDNGCRIIRVEAEKDDTDTMICLKYGIGQGYDEFCVLGGLGGRLDHTIANLQTMSYAVDQKKSIWFLDGYNRATLRNPGIYKVSRLSNHKISLFAFGECCEGVSIRGVKYPLENHLLRNNFPLGVSNEFFQDVAEVSHTVGKLLIILSHD